MFTNSQLRFFQEKIYDLETAVLHNQSHSVLKIPNHIISILHVDDIGQLWFFVKRPTQKISEFEREFYSNLDFARKGKKFFVIVEGKAYLITDPEEINELPDFPEDVKEKARNEAVLVKMRVTDFFYYEASKKKRRNVVELISSWFYNLLNSRRPAYRFYRLEPETGF